MKEGNFVSNLKPISRLVKQVLNSLKGVNF